MFQTSERIERHKQVGGQERPGRVYFSKRLGWGWVGAGGCFSKGIRKWTWKENRTFKSVYTSPTPRFGGQITAFSFRLAK